MYHRIKSFRKRTCLLMTGLLAGLGFSHISSAAPTLKEAFIENADVYAHFRYRYEHVDDDLAADDANASTLRSVFGYQSGSFHGFSTLLEAELVNRVFSGDYAEFPGQPGSTAAVVADPDSRELNQGYLQYAGLGGNRVRVGRQIITYRDAPFHRYMGTVLWRQNWQTHDALSWQNTALPNTTLSYAYIWNVNRIFGDQAPAPLSDFDSDSHVFNVQFDRFQWANLETYAYLLDFDNSPANSSETFGVRVNGGVPWTPAVTPVYALEYAHQADYGGNPGNYDVSYQLIEGGFKFIPAAMLDSLVVKGGYERLSGTGTFAFQTPLGTNHAFQGWADRFLATPADGIRDTYASAVATAMGFKFIAAYHVLDSDQFDYSYGEELDLQLTRGIGQRYTVGLKYADYDADTNATNLARNTGPVTADAQKIWLFATASF